MSIRRLALPWLVLVWTLHVATSVDTEENPPNVLLIVIDTLRADHLSTYGYERKTSPNIDRLASEGTVYENGIAAASWTLPSHASMFTGLFPRDHNTHAEQWTLDERFDTLAERLRAGGYRTAGFSNNVWTNEVSGLKQGFDVFEELFHQQNARVEGISVDDPEADRGARLTNERVLTWIDGRPADDRPFFVFINYFEPHLPYRPTRPFDQHFLPEHAKPHVVQRLRSFYSPREYGYILRLPFMDVKPQELEILTSLYDAEIAYTDRMLGQLIQGLRQRGVLDDTVIVITSDHGEHLGENHMLSHKLSVYEPLLRVPLLLWNPRRLPEPRRIAQPVQNHDLFGSVLELAGVRHHARTLPLSEPESDTAEASLTFAQIAYPKPFLETIRKKIPAGDTAPFERSLLTVRGPRYKLIEGSDGRVELYDLIDDPLESNDLSTQKKEVVATMKRYLEQFRAGKLP
ncbi:MAG: sulfatase-like hydrolase/transferase [Thermoanaerobaculia bacterium]|nr:sulfatase-like hydrolase/transferase [Thermoanaerobaculia bacterium]